MERSEIRDRALRTAPHCAALHAGYRMAACRRTRCTSRWSAASRTRNAASRESVTAERTAELDASVIWFCALLEPAARVVNAADSRATVARRCDRGFIGFSKEWGVRGRGVVR